MFTGIVEELGRIRSRDGGRFTVEAAAVLDGAGIGDSIAHNGVCLTVVELGDGWYVVEAVDETLARSNLGQLQPGDQVNLERPVRLVDRLGGHIVQGHVDGVAEVIAPAPDLELRLPAGLERYVVEKGSITVDGCSLTVAAIEGNRIRIAVIPHTAEVTTLGRKQPGDTANLEVDVLAKYVERLLETRD